MKAPDKINILHLNASNFYGGPEKQIIEHLDRLDKKRFQGTVVSFQKGEEVGEIIKEAHKKEIPGFSIPSKKPLDLSALSVLRKILVDADIELLCTHGFKSTVIGWLVAHQMEIPVIAFSRGYTKENFKVSVYEWLERRILNKVDAIISVSEAQRIKLKKLHVEKEPHWVVRNAVSTKTSNFTGENFKQKFCDMFEIPQEAMLIVTAGRLSPEKGHADLLKAIAQLPTDNLSLCFIIAGDGVYRQKLELQAYELGIAERCRFIGVWREMDQLYKIMDFLVLPSLTEGLPNVILEAFSHKKTVLATAVGGVPEVVKEGETGLLVEPENPEQLKNGIIKLVHSKDLRTEYGLRAFQTVRSDFSFAKQNAELENLYLKVISKRYS